MINLVFDICGEIYAKIEFGMKKVRNLFVPKFIF